MPTSKIWALGAEMATQTGYKASELGMIPQDWEIRRIGDFAPLQRGFDLPNSEIQSGDYPVVYSNGIGNYHNCYTVKSPCIATGRSGTLGKVHYVEQDCWVHNTSLWVTKFDNCEPKFIYFLFQKIGFERFASGSGVPTLNRNDAHEFKIALPKSTAEQTAIATVLSDTDALISSLQTLIAKKQAIKLSAMQNLLSGKIRLPEFTQRPDGSSKTTRQTELGCVPEDWEVVELEKVAEIKSGGTPSTNRSEFWNGHILWCTPTDITSLSGKYLSDTNRKITEMGLNNSAAELLPIGSVLMTSRATIGECAIAKRPMTTNQGFKNFICNRTVNNEFLYYLLSSQKDKFIELCNGSTFLEISTTQVRKFKITIPKSTTEQTSIAQLLSNMDAEIEALGCRLKKTQALKQGMMQALLTGKIRLPLE
ncbi:restriction endonuclease subunit S [Neisseria mucosa]|jgi:restriction modification system DNA specificity domain protein|uniref:Restriction endonuclease subunit S n=1 Tax=Neisseria mucosa TaxID=488 RepID=A0AAW6ZBP1_NEIMU|nr:restriction endonuclease subunit S [Neisseria mucosa]MDK6871660.1 restriction endonuclease subunit S [Neisseria mucosa]MDK8362665.1 restriction endonuclease subunit S [Neisseria mucosa]